MERRRTNSISSLFRLRRLRELEAEEAAPYLDILMLRPGPDVLRSYYTAIMALTRGSSNCPGLPLELVIRRQQVLGRSVHLDQRLRRDSGSKPSNSRKKCSTAPAVFNLSPCHVTRALLTANTCANYRTVFFILTELVITITQLSSWSWFEIRVAHPMGQDVSQATFEAKRRPNGDEVSYHSHSHPIGKNGFAEHRGLVFGPGSQLWDEIQEGDVLQVMIKAQFFGRANVANDGILMINTWWEPSPEMLELIYNGPSSE
ncbi:unnamed protein product [Rhizoctonia solani]|uniref:Uncharacterized protein n=1 Tax=Rhizoctonia solani TaxID=456999 RepID=A0A8H3DXS7_9AGAM|nr:unnamed protein product [Rhizoctonia solani]